METPLFRVRDKKETIYCYDETEKQAAMKKLGANRRSHDLKVWEKLSRMSLEDLLEMI